MKHTPTDDTKREVVHPADGELLDGATCPNCGYFVSDDGITVDPRGCCFYCRAD